MDALELLAQAATEGVIECPECGSTLEPDAQSCQCGWPNPLVAEGLI